MGPIWTITRQTVAESIRMRLALFVFVLLGVLLLGLPFASEGDDTLSGAVQSFMAYSIGAVAFLLSCLSVFLCRTLSSDLAGKQIQVIMAKPIARWHYVLGKWLGIMALNTAGLVICGVLIYGMTLLIAGRWQGVAVLGVLFAAAAVWAVVTAIRVIAPRRFAPLRFAATLVTTVGILVVAGAAVGGMWTYQQSVTPRDDLDAERLDSEILRARFAQSMIEPDFTTEANTAFEANLEQGVYEGIPNLDPAREKAKLRDEMLQRWRRILPFEQRAFFFEDVRCSRSAEERIHLRYEGRVYGYAGDEVFRFSWIVGDREKDTAEYFIPRREAIERKHTTTVPADTVAADNSLRAILQNVDPFINDIREQQPNSIVFEKADSVQVLFAVGSFGGNLARALALVFFRLAFLAAVSVAAATLFSYPVAVLVALVVYTLAATRGFLGESIEWLPGEGVMALVRNLLDLLLQGVFFVMPDFSAYDGLQTLVDGRNVTLKWVLVGFARLLCIQTSIVLLIACVLFSRRQPAEVSV